MKKLLYCALVTVLCTSCFTVNSNFNFHKGAIKGIGPVETRTLDLADFNAVCVKGGADLHLSQGEGWAVSVTTQENIFDSLDFVVEDSVLVIQAVNAKTINAEEFEVSLTMPALKSLQINGAAELEALTPWKVGDLDISINGAGELTFDGLACRNLSLSVNGASEFDAKGLDVALLSVDIKGAGEVEVAGKAGDVDLSVSGAGEIDARELTVSGEVRKKAAGAARIRI